MLVSGHSHGLESSTNDRQQVTNGSIEAYEDRASDDAMSDVVFDDFGDVANEGREVVMGQSMTCGQLQPQLVCEQGSTPESV